jgi:hypothetical protein
LYRNLGVFPISFALINGAFAIFGMLDLLTGAESALAAGRRDRQFGEGELLAAGGEKFGDIVDRVVAF